MSIRLFQVDDTKPDYGALTREGNDAYTYVGCVMTELFAWASKRGLDIRDFENIIAQKRGFEAARVIVAKRRENAKKENT